MAEASLLLNMGALFPLADLPQRPDLERECLAHIIDETRQIHIQKYHVCGTDDEAAG